MDGRMSSTWDFLTGILRIFIVCRSEMVKHRCVPVLANVTCADGRAVAESHPSEHGTLSAAQSEYLSQFTQPDSLKSAVGIGSGGVGVSSSFGVANTSYTDTTSSAYQPPSPPSSFTATSAASFSTANYVGSSSTYATQIQDSSLEVPSSAAPPTQTLPSRTKTQRPRVPPPSKVQWQCLLMS
ncbi:hypothetical protein PR048_026832 [Dryococelus australis]|uniref:Uncharacterized protein n=1 Tax=Dryococelus australis TaxID=614101 RepID=A0ABQ9GME1_9NEOP|nr:hypothetical protein PR048_026832 [Dryococelus australis]